MKRNGYIGLGLVICSVLSYVGCRNAPVSERERGMRAYELALEREMQREQEFDSIFFGLHFKMTAGNFFDHCNRMHKKGIFDGNYKNEVMVELSEGFKRPVGMTFYPRFKEPFIKTVPVRFGYANASVFDKTMGSGVLIRELQKVMMDWYGGQDFIEIPPEYPYERPTYVKIDGNREITLKEDESFRTVIAVYKDLNPLY